MVKVRGLGFFLLIEGNIVELTTTKASLIELDSGGTPTNVIEIEYDLPELFGSNRVTVINLKDDKQFILIYENTLHLLDFNSDADTSVTTQADFFHRPDFMGDLQNVGTKGSSVSIGSDATDSQEYSAGTGYVVQYGVTGVLDEVESPIRELDTKLRLPEGTTEGVIFQGLGLNITERILQLNEVFFLVELPENYDTMRLYRRPDGGGTFGFIGESFNNETDSGLPRAFSVDDIGQEADYSNLPPTAPTFNYKFEGGLVANQRLILYRDDEVIASKIGHSDYFYDEYPIQPDSTLRTSVGSAGTKILYMVDSQNGMIAFCEDGIYLNSGTLGVNNLGFNRVGSWAIDPDIPPLSISESILFVDKASGQVRTLIWSLRRDQRGSNDRVNAPSVSIFSNQIFEGRKIKSWAFQQGNNPLIWVVFDDGKVASLSYELNLELRAWTPHDFYMDIVDVVSTSKATWFVGKKGDDEYYYLKVEDRVQGANQFAMDGEVTFTVEHNQSLDSSDLIIFHLPHLDGEIVSVITYKEGDPSNFVYDRARVVNNQLERNDDGESINIHGSPVNVFGDGEIAVIRVGRHIVNDMVPLKINVVDDRFIPFESMITNGFYLLTSTLRSLYAGGELPQSDTVEGMETVSAFVVEDPRDILANQTPDPLEGDIEVSIDGGWNRGGQVFLRSVDPFHFEIFALSPILGVLPSNRGF